jgi:hypothetical protein
MRQEPFGRPTIFTDELANEIVERIASGDNILDICDEEGMPTRVTLWRWKKANKDFCNNIIEAEEEKTHIWQNEVVKIADNGTHDTKINDNGNECEDKEWTNRSKLRVDARLKLMAMMNGRRYGQKIQTDNNHNIQPPLPVITQFCPGMLQDDGK